MSCLRDPELDPDFVLSPERVVELEERAELPRARLAKLGPSVARVVRDWVAAELDVARRRAAEVGDADFIECLVTLERRLIQPGSYLREARISQKLQALFDAKHGPRLALLERRPSVDESR